MKPCETHPTDATNAKLMLWNAGLAITIGDRTAFDRHLSEYRAYRANGGDEPHVFDTATHVVIAGDVRILQLEQAWNDRHHSAHTTEHRP